MIRHDTLSLYIMIMPSLFVVGLLGLSAVSALDSLVPKRFTTLPLGDVRPSGWLADQLDVQMQGLGGHMHEFYPYVSETDWVGGTSKYSYLEEAGSYWFNALVPAGILTNNSEINVKTRQFLDYVLDTQDVSGWLGPEVGTDKPRWLWGRYPFLFGAIEYLSHTPSLAPIIIPPIHKFVKLANTMLRNGDGVEDWTATRWEDFVIVLQWLYDNHRLTLPLADGQQEDLGELLIDTMQRLKWSGVNWEKVFSEDEFPKVAVETLPEEPFRSSWHGVNMAEGLKALPATYRFTGNQSDLTAASAAWDILFKYHGRPSGIFAADEHLAGLEAHRGTELCVVVETMFSGSYLYQVLGDTKFLDRVERIAYNALPATLTGDMWSRQYLQQQNQVGARNMTPNPFPTDGPYSNVFGLEPDYPCCTVNFPQGWPKFIANAFLVTPNQTMLVQAFLGPFSIQTVLAESNPVTVSVKTQYPFSDSLTTSIVATKPFTYAFRVPSWVTSGTISVNGGLEETLSPVDGLQKVTVGSGKTVLVICLPAEIVVEPRLHGAVAIQRGALHYAFDIPRTTKVLKHDPKQELAVDLQMDASAAWQYAIDPSTAQFINELKATDVNAKLPSPIFDSVKGVPQPPVSIMITACPIDWSLAGETFAAPPPDSPVKCLGQNVKLRLIPYGATKLRISEFPTLGKAEGQVGHEQAQFAWAI